MKFHVIWMIYILPRISETAPSWYLRRLFQAIFYWGRKINLPRPQFSCHHNGIANCIRINYRPPLQGPRIRPGECLDVLGLGDALQGDRRHGAPHHGPVVSSTSAILRRSRGKTGSASPLQIRSRGEFSEKMVTLRPFWAETAAKKIMFELI